VSGSVAAVLLCPDRGVVSCPIQQCMVADAACCCGVVEEALKGHDRDVLDVFPVGDASLLSHLGGDRLQPIAPAFRRLRVAVRCLLMLWCSFSPEWPRRQAQADLGPRGGFAMRSPIWLRSARSLQVTSFMIMVNPVDSVQTR